MDTLKIYRKIDSTHLEIDELKNWMGKEVDIIIREKQGQNIPSSGTAAGLLSGFGDHELIKEENKGWEKAVKEKYGNG